MSRTNDEIIREVLLDLKELHRRTVGTPHIEAVEAAWASLIELPGAAEINRQIEAGK